MYRETVVIKVSTVFGKPAYFPEVAFFCLEDKLLVTTEVMSETARENGWTPEVIEGAIQAATDGIEWTWEIEDDLTLRRLTVTGKKWILVGHRDVVAFEAHTVLIQEGSRCERTG